MAQALDKADLANIEEAIKALKETGRLILQAEQSGLDMTDRKTRADEQMQRLLQLKRVFFPTGRQKAE